MTTDKTPVTAKTAEEQQHENDCYMISRCVYAAWGLVKSLKERTFDVASLEVIIASMHKKIPDIATNDRAALLWLQDNFEDIQANVHAIYTLLDMIAELVIEVL